MCILLDCVRYQVACHAVRTDGKSLFRLRIVLVLFVCYYSVYLHHGRYYMHVKSRDCSILYLYYFYVIKSSGLVAQGPN